LGLPPTRVSAEFLLPKIDLAPGSRNHPSNHGTDFSDFTINAWHPVTLSGAEAGAEALAETLAETLVRKLIIGGSKNTLFLERISGPGSQGTGTGWNWILDRAGKHPFSELLTSRWAITVYPRDRPGF